MLFNNHSDSPVELFFLTKTETEGGETGGEDVTSCFTSWKKLQTPADGLQGGNKLLSFFHPQERNEMLKQAKCQISLSLSVR